MFDCQGQTAIVAKGYWNVAFLRPEKAILLTLPSKNARQ